MAIVLGDNRYGKAETRLVRVVRDTERHEIRDLKVSSSLRGDFTAAHLDGDQANVLPTDTQKNAVFAFAKERGVGAPEEFARELARHFVDDVAPVTVHRSSSRSTGGSGPPSTGGRTTTRSCAAGPRPARRSSTAYDGGEHVLSGLTGLVLLKSTGSEFHGFLVDEFTTLPPTHDRVLATSLTVRWRWAPARATVGPGVRAGRALLVARFGSVHSLALQQTLWEMGQGVLAPAPTSRRSGCRRRTSTTTWSTSRRSGSTTRARSSSPPTGPTG